MGTDHQVSDVEEFASTAFMETMDEGNVDAVAKHFSESVAYHRSSGELAGRYELQNDIEMFHAAFPDLEADISRIMSNGDKVSFIYKLRGTHKGEFEGIPPTGQEMDAKGAAIVRIDGDQIGEYRIVFDNLGMLEQLGVLGD
jgi:steroid delta-isomerase-like uncharacterized protein